MKKIVIVLSLILIALAMIYWVGMNKPNQDAPGAVNSFSECQQAGYPVAESYPLQCRTPDGKVFVEDIGNELDKQDLIRVNEPRPNTTVNSPLAITGLARGTWFFEASFPIRITDEQGQELGITVAQAQTDWMTEDFVPFSAILNFDSSTASQGILILEKSNPSGLIENADELRFPVNINQSDTRTVQLYYYNPQLDPDTSCTSDAVMPVTREIPLNQPAIKTTIELLLDSELTAAEKAQGFTTELPLLGVELEEVDLNSGILELVFLDPQNLTSGGSCRVQILRSQIEKTALQFPEVTQVRILPEELFQP